jgi:hypothetical protein
MTVHDLLNALRLSLEEERRRCDRRSYFKRRGEKKENLPSFFQM